MRVRGTGQHLITWAQTQVDGAMAEPSAPLLAGSTWRWFGAPVRLDGPQAALLLGEGIGLDEVRRRAARSVAKMARTQGMDLHEAPEDDEPLMGGSFVVSDAGRLYTVVPVAGADPTGPLLLFPEGIPPVSRPLTIIEVIPRKRLRPVGESGVICFTPGTMVQTEQGAQAVEDLFPGDKVLTKDSGPQEILWMGLRQISGARLFMDPGLRPIRIRAGALGGDGPQPDLVVSPEHRVLFQGRKARALFNTPEVLVRAGDLVDDRRVLVDHAATEVTYVHMLLPRHEVIWANGVETESFHPANADLAHLNAVERDELLDVVPGADREPDAYGPPARRCLSRAELAILRFQNPPHYLA